MRGTVKYAKFEVGDYECMIVGVKAGVTSKDRDVIIVKYQVMSGPKKDKTFTEQMSFVSQKFLQAIGEPHESDAQWDTERWPHKTLWVRVKYSPLDAEGNGGWARYAHFNAAPPSASKAAPAATHVDDEEIPF